MAKTNPAPKGEPSADGAVVYRDKCFLSRVLVLPSGEVARVERSQVAATSEALREYLAQHADFEPLE
ncbi:hypothetical protein VV867_12425 [Pseudomonas sp. JH-2]|uniref:hypothetical protein n=1 Tax=Pseudomonas sp. JH-2 TaxID=3114998 RepID=UPI002E26596D|nr:hypothetical protein [Pseudomonas sp. JH-2]